MTPDKRVEEIDIGIANLLFAGLSIAQMDKIPKWLLENIEKNKGTFRTTLTQHHQDLMSEVVEKIEEKLNVVIKRKNEIENDPFHPVRCQYLGQEDAFKQAQTIIKSLNNYDK